MSHGSGVAHGLSHTMGGGASDGSGPTRGPSHTMDVTKNTAFNFDAREVDMDAGLAKRSRSNNSNEACAWNHTI